MTPIKEKEPASIRDYIIAAEKQNKIFSKPNHSKKINIT